MSVARTDGTSPRKGARLLEGPLLPVIVALLAHGIGVAGGFVGDDIPDIVRHPVVNGAAPWWHVLDYNYMGEPLGQGANTQRPLTTLLFALEWRLWGATPALFHLVSVLAFAGLVWAVHGLFRRFVCARMATAGAAVFAALAIHVDAVGLVANRAEVLSLLLAVLALGAALGGRGWLAAVAYLAALLAKESAFLLPFIVLWHVWVHDGARALHPGRGGRVALPMLGAAGLFLALRAALLDFDVGAHVIAADNMLLDQPPGVRVWMPFVLLGRYLWLTVAPVGLSFDYTYDAIPVGLQLGDAHGWLGLGFVLALLAGGARAWKLRRDSEAARLFLFAAGGFAIAYALFSNSVFLIVTIFAERLFLAPSMWLVLLGLSAAVAIRARAPQATRSLVALAAVLVLVQALLAAQRTRELRDDLTLFAAQVESQPNSVKGRLYYARALARDGRVAEALWELGMAVAGRSAFPGRWQAPVALESLPVAERLMALPAVVMPDAPPERFWARFRATAADMLGPETGAVIDALLGSAAGAAPE